MPPAIFPVLLSFLGLALALRAGFSALGWPMALPDAAAGCAVGLWAFGAFAYSVKLCQRPDVLPEDMKVVTARGALAAATVGGMAAAGLIAPFSHPAASVLLAASLAMHALLVLAMLHVLSATPPEARGVNPGWHLIFVGFIVGAMSAALLEKTRLALLIFWPTAAVAMAIWAISAAQLARGMPPAPLRPLLAIHLAPASLFATVAAITGQESLAVLFATVAVAIFALLVVRARAILAAGFSPLWGSLGFPLAAFSGAMIRMNGAWAGFGLGILLLSLVAVPLIGWGVLRMWPTGALAAKTNAAEV